MQQMKDRVTVYGPEVVTWSVHPVDELLELSKKHHLGFYYMGERHPLLLPEAEDGFIWYPKEMFPKPIHKEALRREEFVAAKLPHIPISQVIIGDEIDENPGPSWEERAQAIEDKIVAGGEKALPIIAKIGLATLAVGVVCAVGVGVVSAVAAAAPVATAVAAPVAVPAAGAGVLPVAAAVGLLALDPQMVLVVSDGYQTHWVCICSWLD